MKKHANHLPLTTPYADEDFLPFGGSPTDTAPGTKERVEVMRSRAERGEQIFHGHDREDFEGTNQRPLNRQVRSSSPKKRIGLEPINTRFFPVRVMDES